jgi:hypothetical protein
MEFSKPASTPSPGPSVTAISPSNSQPYTFGLPLEVYREQVTRGVRMMVRNAKLQGHSRIFLSLEEAELVLSVVPDMEPIYAQAPLALPGKKK